MYNISNTINGKPLFLIILQLTELRALLAGALNEFDMCSKFKNWLIVKFDFLITDSKVNLQRGVRVFLTCIIYVLRRFASILYEVEINLKQYVTLLRGKTAARWCVRTMTNILFRPHLSFWLFEMLNFNFVASYMHYTIHIS